MSFLSGFIWCVVAVSACILTTKFYLPYYCSAKKNIQTPDKPDDSEKPSEDSDDKKGLLVNKTVKLVVLILVGVFAAVCGYFAFMYKLSMINYAKMSLGMLVLFIVVITDLELSVIPNLLVLILLAGRLLCLIPEVIVYGNAAWGSLLGNFLVAVITVVLLFIVSKISKGGLGAGDIKLFGALAFLFGLRGMFFSLFFSLLASALVSITLLILKKKKLRDSFPMGPLICFGCGLSIILALA